MSLQKINNNKEHFENKIQSNNDDFDEQYVQFFDYIFDFNTIHKDCLQLFKNNKIIFKGKILDGGCGTGALSNLIYKSMKKEDNEGNIICVDKSKSFIKKAEMSNIYNRYILGDLVNTELFENDFFNIIISDYDCFYQNTKKDMEQILKNYYLWLKNDGFVLFYYWNNNYLDPSPRDYSMYYFDKNNNKHSMTYFEGFNHNSWFMKNNYNKDAYDFYEKIMIQKSGNVRIKKTSYIIPSRDTIIHLIENNGFFIKNILTYDNINEYEIFILKKKQ